MSAEDLTTIGPVALQQDLAVLASLGIHHAERNGHHYCAGLSGLDADVQRQVLEHHGDLYHPSQNGWPTLTISDGTINLESINQSPFGVGFQIDVDSIPIAGKT